MIYGVGINDIKGGSNKYHPDYKIYDIWQSMIKRCYNKEYQNKFPHYKDVIVCDEWLYYSKFREWAKNNYIEGYQLDKDIIGGNLKIYSPDTCAFVPQIINTCILDGSSVDSLYPIGTYYLNKSKTMIREYEKPYETRISKFGKRIILGRYLTPEEGHHVWQKHKIEYLNELIVLYKDKVNQCVIDGLQKRIDLLQYDLDNKLITKTINKI